MKVNMRTVGENMETQLTLESTEETEYLSELIRKSAYAFQWKAEREGRRSKVEFIRRLRNLFVPRNENNKNK